MPHDTRLIDATLANLRDHPVDTAGTTDQTLALLYTYLSDVPPQNGRVHWFCRRAAATTVESATFLLRLHAYASPTVVEWRSKLGNCLKSCVDCVAGFQRVKVESKDTYFAAFPQSVVALFFTSFEQWEAAHVVQSITGGSLSASPSAVSYHAVVNLAVLEDPEVMTAIRQHPPTACIETWPEDPVPPGILILLMHEDSQVRKWAEMQAARAKRVPIEELSAMHTVAITVLNECLKSDAPRKYCASSDMRVLWSAFTNFIKFVPPDCQEQIYKSVIGHLHDAGPQLPFILKCFERLTKAVGSAFWKGQASEYLQVVFDSIKDNPALSELLTEDASASEEHRYLSWCPILLAAIDGHAAQADIFAKMADFLCEELQHVRFGASRPAIALSVMKLLTKQLETNKDRAALSKVLDIHADFILSVALAESHSSPPWTAARAYARRFLRNVVAADGDILVEGIYNAFKAHRHKDAVDKSEPQLVGGRRIWAGLYRAMGPGNEESLEIVLRGLARMAHLDHLAPQYLKLKSAEELGINRSLNALWEGMAEGFSRYNEKSRAEAALELLQRPGAVEHVFTLLLSPRDEIQLGAQSLVELAFDVDGRQESYRVLLENFSDAAFEALLSFLKRFQKYVEAAGEARSLTQHIVCYMQDVVEVLCSRQGGLIHSPRFLRPDKVDGIHSRLSELWLHLNLSLALIFKCAPPWSRKFDPDMLLPWMRDALILGREIFSQFRTFETLANSRSDTHTRGLSEVGKKLVDALQSVLPALVTWLRLTDEELLYQMFEILELLLGIFKDVKVKPKPDVLERMQKHIVSASDAQRNRLDSSRLLRLENNLAAFVDSPIPSNKPKPPAAELKLETVSDKPRKAKAFIGKSTVFRGAPLPGEQRKFSVTKPVPPKVAPSKPTASKPIAATSSAAASTSRRSSEAPSARSASAPVDEEASSSSDDEDVGPGGKLASLSSMQRSPKIKKSSARRQVQLYEEPVQKTVMQERQERRAQEARRTQRMRPDTSFLAKTILSWDYDHSGSRPPGEPLQLVPVPTEKFNDYAHYQRVFTPLLFLECWEQINQFKVDLGASYLFKVNGRAFSDEWVNVDMSFAGSVAKDWRLTENDIVVLQRAGKSILAKVEAYKTPPGRDIELAVRCLTNLDRGLVLGSEWNVSTVFSLSTVTREYSALLGLPYYDICPAILRPSLPPIQAPKKDVVQKIVSKHRVNEPQATAIASCLETSGFSLIQGPPGTGKTSTIVALVKSHIERRPRKISVPGNTRNAKPDLPEPQILICAPSNAAIDEIAMRIRDADMFKNDGKRVVRLGVPKSMNPSVLDISLDQMIDDKLEGANVNGLTAEIASLRAEVEAVKEQRRQKLTELDSIMDNQARRTLLSDEISRLGSKRTQLSKRLDEVKDNRMKMQRGMDTRRRALRLETLQGAHVICATLSAAGAEYLQDLEIDMVIIDEASQAIELSALIPLKYQPKYAVLVGDPQQLPPTVISSEARHFRYNESLFVRLAKTCPQSMHLLSIQYRMHPAISILPSTIFYQSRLQDGPDMEKKTRKPWQDNPKFGVYRFMNVKSVEDKAGRSLKNATEARIAVALFKRLKATYRSIDFEGQVGVVSMYRAQVAELRQQFTREFGSDIVQSVAFHTVDGFQGQEKSIIILSCVRAGPGQETIGFLSDVRRMNVALTRAKSSLFILGNAPTLSRSDETWSRIVEDAKTRNAFVDVDFAYFTTPDAKATPIATPTLSPTRSRASIAAASAVAPAGLSTPKEMLNRRLSGANVASGSGSVSAPVGSGLKRRLEADRDGPSSPKKPNLTREPPSKPQGSGGGLKRRLDAEPDVVPPAKKPAKAKPPRPPKDAASSLFIPKKKRPP
ncbi:hypothetical protein MKEN_00899300 [Mycena kentingensis (nom. inval.)]|nr:hypothetical protein MKEN_00899300 [Mycena kentingensis (nom. inval.)]